MMIDKKKVFSPDSKIHEIHKNEASPGGHPNAKRWEFSIDSLLDMSCDYCIIVIVSIIMWKISKIEILVQINSGKKTKQNKTWVGERLEAS